MTMENYLENILKLPVDLPIGDIAKLLEFVDIPKGKLIYRAGEPVEKLSFLVEGTVVGVRQDENGHMVVDCIPCCPGDSVTAVQDLQLSERTTSHDTMDKFCTLWNQPTFALCDVIAAENTRIAQISNVNVQHALESYPELLFWVSNKMHESFQKHWETKSMLARYNSAYDRYIWFLNEYPGVIDKVSNIYVAAFLGVDPATLSRQKHKI